ncbi:DnaJ domain-containing protein [Absidia repens]|uniref:DnaJ domain-containing protein n=1 Tax=Absidia repens TaxID=90262 RepID=A0A1X2I8C9_9FUNG|nr:DnaJ domain-containing protein [Absidia repens]
MDYYSILEVPETATLEEIKQAYKKQALLHHPDRLDPSATRAQRQEATQRFQLIADALYTLSDDHRRTAYDKSRKTHSQQQGSSSARPHTTASEAHHLFGDIFKDLLQPEVDRPGHMWRVLGLGAGAIIGYIIGDLGGAAVGAFAGKTLGQIRDNKGVSVYTAFQRLDTDQRRNILTSLLTQFLSGGMANAMK